MLTLFLSENVLEKVITGIIWLVETPEMVFGRIVSERLSKPQQESRGLRQVVMIGNKIKKCKESPESYDFDLSEFKKKL